MIFLADMGISPLTVEWLERQGHDAVHLLEWGLLKRGILLFFGGPVMRIGFCSRTTRFQ